MPRLRGNCINRVKNAAGSSVTYRTGHKANKKYADRVLAFYLQTNHADTVKFDTYFKYITTQIGE